jgi:hypothetical protein
LKTAEIKFKAGGRFVLIIGLFSMLLSTGTLEARLSLHGKADDIAVAFLEQEIFENRNRAHIELKYSPSGWLSLKASGYGEFLYRSDVEDRAAGNFRMHETYLDLRAPFFDLRIGYSNVVWGVLDEIQPNDVINPIDVSRFFFEGRSKARLPIPNVSTDIYLPADLRLGIVLVPFFEKGVFDQLEEETSPFNVIAKQPLAGFDRSEELPEETLRNMEYGARLSWTIRETDIDLYAYKGREDFPILAISDFTPFPFNLEITDYYPRFTMFGGDMETVVGKWGLRGEAAVFLDDSFQHPVGLEVVTGKSLQIGIGGDRKFGDNIVNLNLVYQRRSSDNAFLESPEELSLVAGFDRSFSYDLKNMSLLSVYNPVDKTLFLRWNGRDNLFRNFWLELSLGIFIGSGNDLVGRFQDADFFFLRGLYHF